MKIGTNQQDPSPAPFVAEVRYSLPELLREAKAELDADTFAMEKLEQRQITKLFRAEDIRRANTRS